MKTANFPRGTIQGLPGHHFPFKTDESDWLISITDRGGTDVKVQPQFNRILFLQFNDTDKLGSGELSPDQALQIATFIKEARVLQKNVWANCHAGICRSGAIVTLLMDLGWQLADSDESPRRLPNYLVYDKVRRHFPELKQSWDSEQVIECAIHSPTTIVVL
jgi:hypothetical protein